MKATDLILEASGRNVFIVGWFPENYPAERWTLYGIYTSPGEARRAKRNVVKYALPHLSRSSEKDMAYANEIVKIKKVPLNIDVKINNEGN